MKRLNKLLSILLALAMLLSLTVSVAADSYTITITETSDGYAYTAYKIFDAVAGTGGSYSYTIDGDSAFYTFLSTLVDTSDNPYFNFEQTATSTPTDPVYVVTAGLALVDSNGDEVTGAAATLASLIKAEIDTNASTYLSYVGGTGTASGTSAEISISTGSGYYFINTSLGSLAVLNTYTTAISVAEKNDVPEVTKTVYDTSLRTSTTDDEDSDAAVGDTVYYQTKIENIKGATKLVLHDKMESSLDICNSTDFTVTLYYPNNASGYDTVVLSSTDDYTLAFDDGGSPFGDSCTFEIDFAKLLVSTNDNYDEAMSDGAYIVVEYSATLNENAEIYTIGSTQDNSNDNTTHVVYGNDTSTAISTTETYSYHIAIYKYTSGDESSVLSGVKFVLSYEDSNGDTQYAQLDGQDGVYTVTGWSTSSGDEAETNTDGVILINGLDADVEYWLTETATVDGYNLLTYDVGFKIIGSDDDTNQGKILTYDNSSSSWNTNPETSTQTVNGTSYYSLKIANSTGTPMPSTGGMGTTIFYMVGGVLVVGAVILLITKRRLSNSER